MTITDRNVIDCIMCGSRQPADAVRCGRCGAELFRVLVAPRALPPQPRRADAPLLPPPLPPLRLERRDAMPVIGLLFAAVFVVGLAMAMGHGGVFGGGTLSLAPLVVGALFAQQAWANGRWRAGLHGMLLWGGAVWLIATDLLLPWGVVPLVVWLLLYPNWLREAALRYRIRKR